MSIASSNWSRSLTPPDGTRITEILDGISGAWQRTQKGLAEAPRGEGTPLDKLA